MKNILTSIALSVGTILSVSAQLQTPKASPYAKIEQKVGLKISTLSKQEQAHSK